jgi:hypothetical protein
MEDVRTAAQFAKPAKSIAMMRIWRCTDYLHLGNACLHSEWRPLDQVCNMTPRICASIREVKLHARVNQGRYMYKSNVLAGCCFFQA